MTHTGWAHLVQMSPVKIDAAKRQLFSLTQRQNTKLVAQAAQPTSASPSPEAATETIPKEPSPAVERKGKQLQQQSSVAAGRKPGKATSIKRKRKEEVEVKVRLEQCSLFADSCLLMPIRFVVPEEN